MRRARMRYFEASSRRLLERQLETRHAILQFDLVVGHQEDARGIDAGARQQQLLNGDRALLMPVLMIIG